MTNHSPSPQEFLKFLEKTMRITPEETARARSAERQTGQPVDIIVRELGILAEEAIAAELANFLQLEAVVRLPPAKTNELLERLGLDFAMEKAIIPRWNDDGFPVLAVANPLDTEMIAGVRYFFELPFTLEIAPRSVIDDYVRDVRRLTGSGEAVRSVEMAADVDLERLQDIARDAPVVKFVSRIIQKAVDENATDIHLEPDVNSMQVRFRRDGMLGTMEIVSRSLHAGVVSRLKILARLNIAERRLPQDGRLRLAVRGRDVDFRLSVVPSIHGETVVLRILNRETVPLKLGPLGYDVVSVERILEIIRRPNGMVLVTGPTGSGKTTTLYSILTELNRPEVKIFTVEDPVEYRMAGITQLQIDPAIGLTFASALRSVLRQDPDIILVGEIRDRETAEIAIQAALTGHLVLSTLHTNSAIGSFSRLRDMGIEPFLIDATMRGVIGQRLVRCLCPTCTAQEDNTGCMTCSGSGYKGRQAVFEILQMSDSMRRAMMGDASLETLEATAIQEGMTPMRDHAFKLAQDGITTMAEAMRVIELEGH
ncbi:GspE/PulE family protein [Agrobacterium radiobacter]|uniref:GspE/PulE family protein n=1 Tax=Agrobacterium radiobacter TaxID=362 RepID=A0ABD5LV53_AGRRD